MRRVFLTGAVGQLGLALIELLGDKDEYVLKLTDYRPDADRKVIKLDIIDEATVRSEIERFHPDVIINCAAMTAVDLCETKKEEAYQINALGAKYIAQAASQTGSKLIHISTDYVYDGQADTPYTEESKPNPINVYGQTKLAGDNYVMEYCPKAVILHTTGLYGEGKNFVRTMLQLAKEGRKISVVSDQITTPTSAAELARAIIFLMGTESYGKYHATSEGSTSWYEFAIKIFELTGISPAILPINSSDYPTPAKRPLYSVLDNKRLKDIHGYYMKRWEEALEEYIYKHN